MTGDFIQAVVSTVLKPRSGEPAVTPDQANRAIQRCAEDAVFGTYGDLSWNHVPRPSLLPTWKETGWKAHSNGSVDLEFMLGLPAAMFPVSSGGLQHLVGVLASDVFPAETAGCRWEDTMVRELRFPDGYRQEALATFRAGRDSIDKVRKAFALADRQPLLAFSFKPRVGFSEVYAETTSRQVLRAGFNLVEFDTRHLQSPAETLGLAERLGKAALEVPGKFPWKKVNWRTAFAPNLSQRTDLAIEAASSWASFAKANGMVPVVKVDGGFDGLSTLQAIRTFGQNVEGPRIPQGSELEPIENVVRDLIVTCYPLFRGSLRQAIGPRGMVELLALSGVDLIYPGDRPRFPDEHRPIWSDAHESYIRAAGWYDELIGGWNVMPTIAGGPHPGHLHVAYELLGPNTAYFLGGAVVLHPRGVAKGARLCRNIIDAACRLSEESVNKGRDYADWLPRKLIKEIESYRIAARNVHYIPPKDVFDPENAASEPPKPWYRRGGER